MCTWPRDAQNDVGVLSGRGPVGRAEALDAEWLEALQCG